MKEFKYVITDAQGIHARPASELVKELKGVTSVVKLTKEVTPFVKLTKEGKTVEAKKLMAVMSLGIKCGQEVTVTVEGEDEDAVAEKLENFFKTNLEDKV